MVASPSGASASAASATPSIMPMASTGCGSGVQRQASDTPKNRIAEPGREHVRHLVPQPRRGEALALHEDLACPGARVQRVAGADQRLLGVRVREIPDGDGPVGLRLEGLLQLGVAKLQVLALQRQLGARSRGGGVVDDEVLAGQGLIQLAREIGAGDVVTQPAADRDTAPSRRPAAASAAAMRRPAASPRVAPATRPPPAPTRWRWPPTPGWPPGKAATATVGPQRLVVDRAREVSEEGVEREHRRIPVEPQQRPDHRQHRQREGQQAPAPRRMRRPDRPARRRWPRTARWPPAVARRRPARRPGCSCGRARRSPATAATAPPGRRWRGPRLARTAGPARGPTGSVRAARARATVPWPMSAPASAAPNPSTKAKS